jgi:hypothetical protein
MERDTKSYAINAIFIMAVIILSAYLTTIIHELGHAIMIMACGGKVLSLAANSPLSFDDVSGYVMTNLPYSVSVVAGGVIATTIVVVILYLVGRHTVLSYLMLCGSFSMLYNAAYALSGSDDITWLVQYSWWSALLCLGLVALNLYIAQQGLYDMFDDMRRYNTAHAIESTIEAGRRFNWRPIKGHFH